MSTALILVDMFQYQGNPFRHVIIDSEPWWAASDVCKILDLDNVSQAVGKLDEDERNTIILNDGIRGNPERIIVNEPGLYSLILRSDKPKAKMFKRWVTHEVLPAIRKTGSYSTRAISSEQREQSILLLKEELAVQKKLWRIEKKRFDLLPAELRASSVDLLPKPKKLVAALEDEVLRHIKRLGEISASNLHNRMKQYSVQQLTETCEAWVKAGILTVRQSGHTKFYRMA